MWAMMQKLRMYLQGIAGIGSFVARTLWFECVDIAQDARTNGFVLPLLSMPVQAGNASSANVAGFAFEQGKIDGSALGGNGEGVLTDDRPHPLDKSLSQRMVGPTEI